MLRSSTTRRFSMISCSMQPNARPPLLLSESEAVMKIVNPASGALLAEVEAEGNAAVRRKYNAARAAQPAWAKVPVAKRIEAIARFGERVVAMHETLARTLTQEMGKPIRQARNELNGLQTRLDFFLNASAKALRAERVHAAEKLEERISHEPLGVIANISAWNYPYFVGANVFVPALVTGNAVLYKPSEHATLTGLAIGELMREAGVPQDIFQVIVGAADAGAEGRETVV